MILIFFRFGADHILVRIDGNKVEFGNTVYGAQMATIDGIKLVYSGVIKEFPDLKDNPQWKEIAIQRFKNHIDNLGSEIEREKYIIKELRTWGYIPLKRQVNGFRPEVIR